MARESSPLGRCARIAVVLAMVAAIAPSSASAAPRPRLGINGDTNDGVAQGLGLKYVRQSLDWAPVQPHANAWNWDSVDFRVTAAAQRGLTLLPVLLGGAPWVGAWNQLPSPPDAYARFVAGLADRYGPGGVFWRTNDALPYRPITYIDLWNEPYLEYFSRGGVDPRRYARLVRASALAGRAANPGVRYVMEVDWTPGDPRAEPRQWFIDQMYEAVPDLNRWFHAISVHPFSGNRPPGKANDPYGFSRIAEIRARMIAHGARRKPMWITEVGWSTCPGGPECVSETAQARYYRAVYRLVRRRHRYVRAIYFYNERDLRSGSPSDREAWFGVVRSDGSHKPAYYVLRRLGRHGA